MCSGDGCDKSTAYIVRLRDEEICNLKAELAEMERMYGPHLPTAHHNADSPTSQPPLPPGVKTKMKRRSTDESNSRSPSQMLCE